MESMEALAVLDKMASLATGPVNRMDHARAQEAAQVLNANLQHFEVTKVQVANLTKELETEKAKVGKLRKRLKKKE